MSTHYASDVPRYTKIIQPEEVGGKRLAGGVIERVEMDIDNSAVLLHLQGEPEPVPVPILTRLTVETTARREARLEGARTLISGETCNCPMGLRAGWRIGVEEGSVSAGSHHSRGCPMYRNERGERLVDPDEAAIWDRELS